MIRALLVSLVFCIVATPALAQSNRASSLGWMSGAWAQDNGKEKVMESWVGPGNGTLVGVNLTTGPNGRRSYEFMRIADTPEGMSYFASPAGRPPVEFRFREAGDKRVVFENAAHDYPQRIVYWKDGDLLAARIEGTVRGQKRSEEWRMAPVAPVAGGGSGG